MKFKITARETRGGYRGIATLGNGVVAMKTVPVFRAKADALAAMRAWLAARGAQYGDAKAPWIIKAHDLKGATHRIEIHNEHVARHVARVLRSRGYTVRIHSTGHADRRIAYRESRMAAFTRG